MNLRTRTTLLSLSITFALAAHTASLHAQAAPIPVKPGLWEMQITTARAMALPPEAEARIAAMPPAQQDQVRAMMGGAAGGGKPVVTTRQVCMAGKPNMDNLLNQARQSSGMQCTFSNRSQTARGASFDTSCTGQMGTAQGHTEFHLIDDEHIAGANHMSIVGASQGRTATTTIDTKTSAKFVAADCGDVKPLGPPTAQ